MQSALLFFILIVALIVLAIQYGVAKAQKKAAEKSAKLGAEIEKIIARNANMDKHEWVSWLQERNNEQK